MTATGTRDELRETAERLHAAAIRLLRTLRREDDGSGLTAPRLSALSVIVFAGPLSLAALAEAEQVRPPTMSRIVDALVARGLVTRTPDPNDRRTIRIAATEAGIALLHAGRARRVEALVARLAGFSGPDRRALARGLLALEKAVR
jgi:DNA-binding MarR family transcriptional regulator